MFLYFGIFYPNDCVSLRRLHHSAQQLILLQLREMMCEMKWGDLKCLQKPTNQMEIDGGLFPDTV